MKLCSVCDKKIEGSWCKNCRRFVKSYEISDRIHMNESHNPANDLNCDYHGTVAESGGYGSYNTAGTGTSTNKTYKSSGTKSAAGQYSTARSTSKTTSSSANNKAQSKKKAGGTFVKIVKWYIIFMVLGTVLPLVWGAVSKEKESKKDSVVSTRGDKYVSTTKVLLADLEPEEEDTIEFADTEYHYKYYDPEDIKALNVSCDAYHMELTATDFDEILKDCFENMQSWEYWENIDCRYNYLEERSNGETFVYFNTWRHYFEMDSLTVSVNYDTSSENVHDIQIAVDLSIMDLEESIVFCQELIEELDDDYELTSEEFQEAVESIMEGETWGSDVLYESDSVWINLIKSEEDTYSIYIQ